MEYRRAAIYRITNPFGKIYIGSTINLNDRIYRYKTCRLGKQIKIKNSINKYGWDAHKFEVLMFCDEKYRNKYEALYGLIYNSLSEENLNLSLPKSDLLTNSISESTKIKIGNAHRGKKISDEQKVQMSISLKKTFSQKINHNKGRIPWNKGKQFLSGDRNPMYGVIRSLEWRKNQSNRMKKNAPRGSNHSRSRIIIDLNSGVFYYGLKELHSIIGGNYSTLRGKLNGSDKNKTQYRYV